MNFFQTVTDLSLKRIYKFILKRVLGSFLSDDLSLEQILLESREGKIHLNDLLLNCDHLNDLNIFPSFKVISCHVKNINAKISYSSLLDDGISFEVSDIYIKLEFSPLPSNVHQNTYSNPKNTNKIPTKDSNNEAESLKFLASWIEIVIAKLKLKINNIFISVCIPINLPSSNNLNLNYDEASIEFKVDEIMFYNSHPNDKISLSKSVDLSSRFHTDQSSIFSLGKRKLIVLRNISISSNINSNRVPIINLLGDSTINIRSVCNRLNETEFSFDITLTQLVITLSSEIIIYFLNVMNHLQPDHSGDESRVSNNRTNVLDHLSTQSMFKFAKYLDHIDGKDDNDEIDFKRLNELMIEYRKAFDEIETNKSNVVLLPPTYVKNKEDEIDFPSSEEDEDEDEDENEDKISSAHVNYGNKKNIRSVSFKKSPDFSQSFYGEDSISSIFFKSTFEYQTSSQANANATENEMNNSSSTQINQTRIHIVKASVVLLIDDSIGHNILFNFDTIILYLSHGPKFYKLTLSASSFSILDSFSGQSVLEFFNEECNRNIISSPELEVEFTHDYSSNHIKINISFEPFLLVMNANLYKKIGLLFESFKIIPNNQPSKIKYSLLVHGKLVEITVHHEDMNYHEYHQLLSRESNKQSQTSLNHASRWSKNFSSIFRGKFQKSFGFRITLKMVKFDLDYHNNENVKINMIELNKVNIHLFEAQDINCSYINELLLLNINGSDESPIEIMINKQPRSILNEEFNGIVIEESSPISNAADQIIETVIVKCKTAYFDVWEFEFSFSVNLFTTVIELFNGVVLNTNDNVSEIISQDKSLSNHSKKASTFHLKIISDSFTSTLIKSLNLTEDSLEYCPELFYKIICTHTNFVVYCDGKKSQIGIHADKFSIFESDNENFNGLLPFFHFSCIEIPDEKGKNNMISATQNHSECFKCLISFMEDVTTISNSLIRHVVINLNLANMSLAFYPNSNWILNLSKIFSGNSNKSKKSSNSPEIIYKTQIFISISNFLVNYYCHEFKVRILNKISFISISSNLSSNSSKMGFRFFLKDFETFISKYSHESDELNQLPCKVNRSNNKDISFLDYLNTHKFLLVYGIDNLDLNLLHDTKTLGISIDMNIGFLNLHGSIDSFLILSSTLILLWDLVKPIPKERTQDDHENSILTEEHAIPNDNEPELSFSQPQGRDETQDISNLTSAAFVQTLDQRKAEVISNEKKQMDTGQVLSFKGLNAAVVENYYSNGSVHEEHGFQEEETQGRWFANYGYDDDDDDDDNDDDEEDPFSIHQNLEQDNFETEIDNEERGLLLSKEITGNSSYSTDEDSLDIEHKPITYSTSTITNNIKTLFGYDSMALLDLEMDEILKTAWMPSPDSNHSSSENLNKIHLSDTTIKDVVDNNLVQSQIEFDVPICQAYENINLYRSNVEELDTPSNIKLLGVINDTDGNNLVQKQVEPDFPLLQVYEHNIRHEDGTDDLVENHLNRSGYCYDNNILNDNEENAYWYMNAVPGNILNDERIIDNHMACFKEEPVKSHHSTSYPSSAEMFISIKLSMRLRLFGGSDWTAPMNSFQLNPKRDSKNTNKSIFDPPKLFSIPTKNIDATSSRDNKDIFEFSAKDVLFEFRTLIHKPKAPTRNDNLGDDSDFELLPPHQFVTLKIQDLLLSFTKKGNKKRKVIGRWKCLESDSVESVMTLTISTGYQKSSSLNQLKELDILILQMEPMRCYLDWYFIAFLKQTFTQVANYKFSSHNQEVMQSESVSTQEEHLFFLFRIFSIKTKIDFKCGNFNIEGLRQGDFSQLLNIFPLDGLEIDLQQIDLRRASGFIPSIEKSLEIWVNDIYERQLHKVISGAAPLRGLSKLGNGLQNLIFIPISEYKKHGFDKNFLRALKQSAASFMFTLTTEALHASHQLTMLVANSIKDLVSDESCAKNESTNKMIDGQQPIDVKESLNYAYGALKRELGSTHEMIVAVPVRQYEHSGAGGYMKSVIRALPVAILRPAAGLSEAISYTLLGLRNQLNPEAKLDAEDEWSADHSIFLSSRQP